MGWIKNRIDAEYRKHKRLDWSALAEAKIMNTIKQVIDEWKEENNCILKTEDIIKEKIVIADYIKWDKIKELKVLISNKQEND